MSLKSHLRPHGTSRRHDPRPAQPPGGSRVFLVQRAGALVVAGFLLVFGLLGFAGGLLAYESLHRSGRFNLPSVIGWFALYIAFIVVVVV